MVADEFECGAFGVAFGEEQGVVGQGGAECGVGVGCEEFVVVRMGASMLPFVGQG